MNERILNEIVHVYAHLTEEDICVKVLKRGFLNACFLPSLTTNITFRVCLNRPLFVVSLIIRCLLSTYIRDLHVRQIIIVFAPQHFSFELLATLLSILLSDITQRYLL